MNFRPLLISALCLLPLAATAQSSAATKPANDPTFRLINASDKTITEVFATPAGRDNWGKNRLDQGTLLAQGAHVFKLPRDGNCIYDLKVVFIDGAHREKKATNLCKLSDLPVK
jgi:hypothetical protein